MSDIKHTKARRSPLLNKRYGSSHRVSRYDYRLVWCDMLEYEGREVRGLHDHITRTIYVLDASDTLETFLHELLHAEIEAAGMRQMPSWNPDLEEQVVELCSRLVAHNYEIRRRRRS